MTGPFFIDTNVLVYAEDLDAGPKRDAARALGASIEEVRSAPEFRRVVLSRGAESVVVGLVVERQLVVGLLGEQHRSRVAPSEPWPPAPPIGRRYPDRGSRTRLSKPFIREIP